MADAQCADWSDVGPLRPIFIDWETRGRLQLSQQKRQRCEEESLIDHADENAARLRNRRLCPATERIENLTMGNNNTRAVLLKCKVKLDHCLTCHELVLFFSVEFSLTTSGEATDGSSLSVGFDFRCCSPIDHVYTTTKLLSVGSLSITLCSWMNDAVMDLGSNFSL